jgi:hypothetical protein
MIRRWSSAITLPESSSAVTVGTLRPFGGWYFIVASKDAEKE